MFEEGFASCNGSATEVGVFHVAREGCIWPVWSIDHDTFGMRLIASVLVPNWRWSSWYGVAFGPFLIFPLDGVSRIHELETLDQEGAKVEKDKSVSMHRLAIRTGTASPTGDPLTPEALTRNASKCRAGGRVAEEKATDKWHPRRRAPVLIW